MVRIVIGLLVRVRMWLWLKMKGNLQGTADRASNLETDILSYEKVKLKGHLELSC